MILMYRRRNIDKYSISFLYASFHMFHYQIFYAQFYINLITNR